MTYEDPTDPVVVDGMRLAREGAERASLRQEAENARGELREASRTLLVLRDASHEVLFGLNHDRLTQQDRDDIEGARELARNLFITRAREWRFLAAAYEEAMRKERDRFEAAARPRRSST